MQQATAADPCRQALPEPRGQCLHGQSPALFLTRTDLTSLEPHADGPFQMAQEQSAKVPCPPAQPIHSFRPRRYQPAEPRQPHHPQARRSPGDTRLGTGASARAAGWLCLGCPGRQPWTPGGSEGPHTQMQGPACGAHKPTASEAAGPTGASGGRALGL